MDRVPDHRAGSSIVLLRRWQAGDQSAFAEVWQRHEAVLRKSIAARMGRRLRELTQVDDILQDTFLEAVRWLDQQTVEHRLSEGGLRHVLAKIALQKLADAGRSATAHRRDVRRNQGDAELAAQVVDPRARPSQGARVGEIEAAREDAMLRLDPEDRLLLDMRDNLAMESREIAQQLGRKVEVARVQISRARARLAALLKQFG